MSDIATPADGSSRVTTNTNPAGPSRRSVVAAGALVVPAAVLTTAVPAFAASPTGTLSAAASPTTVIRGGTTRLTVTFTDTSGTAQAGKPISLTTGASGVSFAQPNGVTDTSGQFTTTISVDQTAPRGTVTITAVSGSLQTFTSFQVNATPTVPTPGTPRWVAVRGRTRDVYVTDAAGNLTVYDGSQASMPITASMALGTSLQGVASGADGSRMYVAKSDSLLSIDATTNAVAWTIALGGTSSGVATSTDNNLIAVSDSSGGKVNIVNSRGFLTQTSSVGSSPRELVFSPNSRYVYVAVQGTGNVVVLNLADSTVDATINISDTTSATPSGLAISPDGSTLYVGSGGTIVVINTATRAITRVMPAPISVASASVRLFAQSPTAQTLYTVDPGSRNLVALRASDATLLGTKGVGSGASVFAVSDDGAYAFILNASDASVSRVDLSRLDAPTPVTSISTARPPLFLAMSVDGTVACATSSSPKAVMFIDVATKTALPVMSTSATGESLPRGVAFNADASRALVVNGGQTNTVSVIDVASRTEVRAFAVGSGGSANNILYVSYSPDWSQVWVPNWAGSVAVHDATTYALIATISVGGGLLPQSLVFSPDGATAYINCFRGAVYTVDVATRTVGANVQLGVQLRGMVISPDGSRLYVASDRGRRVIVVDVTTMMVLGTISLEIQANDVQLSADGAFLYVVASLAGVLIKLRTSDWSVVSNSYIGGEQYQMAWRHDYSELWIANHATGGGVQIVAV